MPFEKGHKLSLGVGRPKGSTNKTSLFARELIAARGETLVDMILDRIEGLPQREQVHFLCELLPYVYPKLASVEVKTNPSDERPLKDVSDEELDAILVQPEPKDEHY